jgi:hypothetical protein
MGKIKIFVNITLIYCALYSTIWLHEFGHAIFYYSYGCKLELFQLHVPFYFAAASPGQIEQTCYNLLSSYQHIWASMGGIIMNLVLALGMYVVLLKYKNYSKIILFANFFILSNLIEAASYLTLNNIRPMGDITEIAQYFPLFRIPLALIGTGLIFIIIRFIQNIQKPLRFGMVVFFIATVVCMFGLRFLFAA